MNITLKLKDNIIVLSFVFYIFLWGFSINNNYILRYFILIPFLISFIDKRHLQLINQKKFFIIPLFLVLHYLIINLINSETFLIRDIFGIIFLCTIIYTFLIYKELLIKNFIKILKTYFFFLILSSLIYERNVEIGSCSSSFLATFTIFENISISKGFFIENSHLAMVNIGALISSLYVLVKKSDKLLLFFTILSFLINILNLSTTFILGYIICSILFVFLFDKKIFKNILILTSIIFAIFFYYSYDCKKKYSYINLEDIKKEKLVRDKSGDLTSTIYERSIILSLRTLKTNPLGWGFDGTIKATNEFFNYRDNKNLHLDYLVWQYNLRDALGNVFKLLIEFGYLNIFLIIVFINYIRKKNITEFEIFLISIFVVQLFRGAGYINGGFIIAFTEIFLASYILKKNQYPKKINSS